MKRIRTIIVDDEPICREGIRTALEKDDDFLLLAECKNGVEAIELIKTGKPDFVILDVQMPEINGFDVLAAIDEEQLPLVLFVTAYDKYAIQAFEVHAVDYVLKPFSEQRLINALQRVKDVFRTSQREKLVSSLVRLMAAPDESDLLQPPADEEESSGYSTRILVRTAGGLKMIKTNSISHIRADEYYAQIICEDGSFLHRESLKKLESMLDPGVFFRSHKSFIVNLDKVRKIMIDGKGDYAIVMENKQKIPVSRRRRGALLKLGRSTKTIVN